jgi:hypothetical protein
MFNNEIVAGDSSFLRIGGVSYIEVAGPWHKPTLSPRHNFKMALVLKGKFTTAKEIDLLVGARSLTSVSRLSISHCAKGLEYLWITLDDFKKKRRLVKIDRVPKFTRVFVLDATTKLTEWESWSHTGGNGSLYKVVMPRAIWMIEYVYWMRMCPLRTARPKKAWHWQP